jgi:hypothetical protein
MCGDAWPCVPAKSQLAKDYAHDKGALMVYLALQMWDAFDDGIGSTGRVPIPPDLNDRFIAWALPVFKKGNQRAA